jgi:hypothetical protein
MAHGITVLYYLRYRNCRSLLMFLLIFLLSFKLDF